MPNTGLRALTSHKSTLCKCIITILSSATLSNICSTQILMCSQSAQRWVALVVRKTKRTFSAPDLLRTYPTQSVRERSDAPAGARAAFQAQRVKQHTISRVATITRYTRSTVSLRHDVESSVFDTICVKFVHNKTFEDPKFLFQTWCNASSCLWDMASCVPPRANTIKSAIITPDGSNCNLTR